jgi:hypothetical protein
LFINILLFTQHLIAQPVQQITSNFEGYFKGDDKNNLSLLKNYLDEKDDTRQDILNQIDDINSKLKTLNIDTNAMCRAENSIKSVISANPANKGIFAGKELRPEILAMALRFGRGTFPSINSKDTTFRYNLNFLLDDIQAAKATFRDQVNMINILNSNLKAVNSDRQKAENLIQNIFSVEKGNQEFKTRISLYFSGIIVVLLIVFFLFIYLKSEHGVANEFLSGNGIQFVALFSLIIAIVLFGILGVLEGRELAAILSGISGFILGKGITKSDDKNPAPQAIVPHTPDPQAPPPKNDEPGTE